MIYSNVFSGDIQQLGKRMADYDRGEDNMIKTPKKSLFLILICQINE